MSDQPLIDKATRNRFWAKVDKSGKCWEWTAGRKGVGKNSYGSFKFDGSTIGAHRFVMMLNGFDIKSRHVLHKCDNPPCVNPSHLFISDQAENIADMNRKGRHVAVPGMKNGNAKLTDDQVIWIRNNAHLGCVKLSKIFNVSDGLIGHITKRRAWKHI